MADIENKLDKVLLTKFDSQSWTDYLLSTGPFIPHLSEKMTTYIKDNTGHTFIFDTTSVKIISPDFELPDPEIKKYSG